MNTTPTRASFCVEKRITADVARGEKESEEAPRPMTTQAVVGGLKRCSRCGTTKPPAEFKSHEALSSGLDSWCMKCHRDSRRKPPEPRTCKLDGCDITFLTARPVGFHDFCCDAHRRKASKQRERRAA